MSQLYRQRLNLSIINGRCPYLFSGNYARPLYYSPAGRRVFEQKPLKSYKNIRRLPCIKAYTKYFSPVLLSYFQTPLTLKVSPPTTSLTVNSGTFYQKKTLDNLAVIDYNTLW